MSAATVADTSAFTGRLLHYLQDLLDDLYNLHPPQKKKNNSNLNASPFQKSAEEEFKIALLYKISKVAFWVNYLLGSKPTSKKEVSGIKKIKELKVVEEVIEESSTDGEQEEEEMFANSDITVENDSEQLEFSDANEFLVVDKALVGQSQQQNVEDNSASTASGFSAFEVPLNSMRSLFEPEILNCQEKEELRARRCVYRQLRRLCRNVRKDCDYQLEKCGF